MRQEQSISILASAVAPGTGDVTSAATSNGSTEKKETSSECIDSFQAEHSKELTTPTSNTISDSIFGFEILLKNESFLQPLHLKL